MSGWDVSEYIAALRAGWMSLDEVAERFRQRDWQPARRPVPTTYAEMAARQDVEADLPGSYDEVTAAYDRGDLTSHEYRVLSDAVAEAIDARTRATGVGSGIAGEGRAERPEQPGPASDDPGGRA
jgi:hypothetical protein